MTDRQAKHRSRATRLMTSEERIATSDAVNDYLNNGWTIGGTTCLINSSLIHVMMSSPDPFDDAVIVILK